MVNQQASQEDAENRSHRAVLPFVTAFAFMRAILANSPVKTNVKLLCFAKNRCDG
jgi:hypothetical protein